MVVASTSRPEDNARDWRSLVITVLVVAGGVGGLFWLACDDWFSGLLAAGSVVGMAVVGLAINVVFGIICIPPMMLVMKLVRSGRE